MKRHTLLFKVTVDTEKDAPLSQEQISTIERILDKNYGVINTPKLKDVRITKDHIHFYFDDPLGCEILDVRFSHNVTADYDESGLTLKEPAQ